MGSRTPPDAPVPRLENAAWELASERVEPLFEGFGVRVEGHTRVYEDTDLRERVVAAGGEDRVWRFFFFTGLDISPPPGIGASSLLKPRIVREAKREFAEELRERGFEAVEEGRTRTVRPDGGPRARFTPYRARFARDGGAARIGGGVAVWYDRGFRIAGGAYPESGLEGVDLDAEAFEDELLDLVLSAVSG